MRVARLVATMPGAGCRVPGAGCRVLVCSGVVDSGVVGWSCRSGCPASSDNAIRGHYAGSRIQVRRGQPNPGATRAAESRCDAGSRIQVPRGQRNSVGRGQPNSLAKRADVNCGTSLRRPIDRVAADHRGREHGAQAPVDGCDIRYCGVSSRDRRSRDGAAAPARGPPPNAARPRSPLMVGLRTRSPDRSGHRSAGARSEDRVDRGRA